MAETITAPVLTREERRQRFIESGWWVSIPCTTVPAHWLYQGENRLDAGYYTAEANAAFRAVNDCGFEVRALEGLTDQSGILADSSASTPKIQQMGRLF